MKKPIPKGTHGYINQRKKILGFTTLGFFIGILIMYVTGYLLKGTRNNICTVLAILTVIPTAKIAISFFILFFHHSCEDSEYQEIAKHVKDAIFLTELVLTTKEKFFPILLPYAVIADGSVCGYIDNPKCDISYLEKFLIENFKGNGVKANIKIFKEKRAFLKRVDALAAMKIQEEGKKKDERIRTLFFSLSL